MTAADAVLTDHIVIDGLTCNPADGGCYEINSAEDLQTLSAYVNGGHNCSGLTFKQTADIDMYYVDNFTAIGNNSSQTFNGTFDGNGKTISNLKSTETSSSYQGLFGYLNGGGTIENVTLKDANITGRQYVGGIVGRKHNGTVKNCKVIDSEISSTLTSSEHYMGGIVGCNNASAGNIDSDCIVVGLTMNCNEVDSEVCIGAIAGKQDTNAATTVGGYFGDCRNGGGKFLGSIGLNDGDEAIDATKRLCELSMPASISVSAVTDNGSVTGRQKSLIHGDDRNRLVYVDGHSVDGRHND